MNGLEVLQSYPYLFACAGSTLSLAITSRFLLSKEQHRIAILAGFLHAPGCVFIPFFEGDYWHPRRLGGWILGVEDVLCSFLVAFLAWVVVALILRGRLSVVATPRGIPRRYTVAAALSIGLFLAAILAGLDAMSALLVTYLLMTLILLVKTQRLWPLAIAGMIGFGLTWSFAIACVFWLWPDFVQQWNMASLWGWLIHGIPIGELTWALAFGAYWPLFFSYSLGGHSAAKAGERSTLELTTATAGHPPRSAEIAAYNSLSPSDPSSCSPSTGS